jgi:hypothetical protein
LNKDAVNSFHQVDLDNEEEEVNECTDLAGNMTEFRAGSGQQKKKSAGYSQTGILTGVCPHRVPIAILPMETKGEKFFMVHAMLQFIEDGNYPGEVDFYSYDVACRLKSYLESRDNELHQRVEDKLVLGYLHSKSHKCRQWNVGFSKTGSGYNDGEQGERLNSWMLKYVAFLRYMREENMYESMEDFLMSHTGQTNANMDQVLQKKFKQCMEHLFEWHAIYVKLCTELEDRLSQYDFLIDEEVVTNWVQEYMAKPDATASLFPVTGTKAEQEYAWALFEWQKLGADLDMAKAALHEMNELGDHLEDCLLDKKKYLLSVVKTYECMTKKRVKVMVERDVSVLDGETILEPLLSAERYSAIIKDMHEARIKELQAAHDSAHYEAKRLRQKQQSGTQEHLVVSEKRRLAALIRKMHRARKKMINDMVPFVRYMVENNNEHGIPENWKATALAGLPYWCTTTEGDSGTTPSISEKNGIVESYLKCQRAWEQVTEILPRELLDAMCFFCDAEQRATEFISIQLDETCTIERRQYHMGCLAIGQDIFARARECRLKCRNVWREVETELQSELIKNVTTVSGENGGVRVILKINATLPLIRLSLDPNEELMHE